jgi:hypothetical protein
MASDPRLSFRFGRKLGYRRRVCVRDDDLDAECPLFRKGYDAIDRFCVRVGRRHADNMAWRTPIGNPASRVGPVMLQFRLIRYPLAYSIDGQTKPQVLSASFFPGEIELRTVDSRPRCIGPAIRIDNLATNMLASAVFTG